jgi:hypothetical protein
MQAHRFFDFLRIKLSRVLPAHFSLSCMVNSKSAYVPQVEHACCAVPTWSTYVYIVAERLPITRLPRQSSVHLVRARSTIGAVYLLGADRRFWRLFFFFLNIPFQSFPSTRACMRVWLPGKWWPVPICTEYGVYYAIYSSLGGLIYIRLNSSYWFLFH